MPNQTYSIVDLGTLGGSESRAWAINNNGQVVGDAQIGSGQFRAFRFTDINSNQQLDPGEMQDLGIVDNLSESRGRDINNNGQVVGFLAGSNGTTHAFIWDSTNGMKELESGTASALSINSNGQAVGFFKVAPNFHAIRWENNQKLPLITPVDNSSWATSNNDNGDIVGYTNIFGTGVQAFLWNGGTMQDAINLGTLDNTLTTRAWDINSQGKVVGQSGSKAFFWTASGGMKDLGSLGGTSQAFGINTNSQVVGKSNNLAFLWSDTNSNSQSDPGEMIDLNTLLPSSSGWSLTEAQGINDAGQIVGTGTINGQTHAFLLTPTSSAVDLSVNLDKGSETDKTAVTVTATTLGTVNSDRAVTVTLTGTATEKDFIDPIPQQIIIPAGQTKGSFTVKVKDDTLVEGTETATFTISNPSAGLTLGQNISSSIAITDNDTAVRQGDYGDVPYAGKQVEEFISKLKAADKDERNKLLSNNGEINKKTGEKVKIPDGILDQDGNLTSEGEKKLRVSLGDKGCFASSQAMAVNILFPNRPPENTQTFNDKVVATGGFTEIKGIANWNAKGIPIYKGADPDAVPALKSIDKNLEQARTSNIDEIKKALEAGNPVLLNVNKGGHWVLAKGVNPDGTFVIIDPGSKNNDGNKTLEEMKTVLGTKDKPNARIIRLDNKPSANVIPRSPIDLVITDPTGKRIGFDPKTNSSYDEITNSAYTIDYPIDDPDYTYTEEDLENLRPFASAGTFLDSVMPGTYNIQVTGIADGEYQVDFSSDKNTGDLPTVSFGGFITKGQVVNYQVKLDSSLIPTLVESSNTTNNPPVATQEISNQTATKDSAFSFTIPQNAFSDIDAGDSISYSATLENGSKLPTWLSFDGATQTFSGIPTNNDLGSLIIKVIATDRANESANTTLNITVIDKDDNNPPAGGGINNGGNNNPADGGINNGGNNNPPPGGGGSDSGNNNPPPRGIELLSTTRLPSFDSSFLLDSTFYLNRHPDVAAALQNGAFRTAFEHFSKFGFTEGRAPSALFASDYLTKNQDVATAVTQGVFKGGFEHFIKHGMAEGRDPSSALAPFDMFYLAENPDVAQAVNQGFFKNGLEHLIRFGMLEGRDPQARYSVLAETFDPAFYSATNPDVAQAVQQGSFRNSFEHFVHFGMFESRNLSQLFNNSFYLTQNSDVAAAIPQGFFKSGFEHFMKFGMAEGRVGAVILGSASADRLEGNAGANIINGSAGNDTIIGSQGNDFLIGGPGNDLFVLGSGTGVDAIADFQIGQDRLGLSGGLKFEQLAIAQGTGTSAQDTFVRIAANDELLAILSNVPASSIADAAFTLV